MKKSYSRRKILRSATVSISALAGLRTTAPAHAQFSWMQKPSQQPGRFGPRKLPFAQDNLAIQYFPQNCERCGDCVAVCQNVQTVYGHGKYPLNTVPCIYCGQCTAMCWNNGVTERFHLQGIYNEIAENQKNKGPKKFVALVAPSVRVTLGEMFKMERGKNVEKQLVAALRKIGFDYVFDVAFGADLTVMEETAELEERLKNMSEGTAKPMFTSCCPAWVRFVEQFFPDVLPQLSTCKSPIQMHATVLKNWFAKEKGIDAENLVITAITPCTAKKYERTLGENNPVKYSLTTRECGWWLQELQIPFAQLEDREFDSTLGNGSGAGVIFGNTGGVTEAVVRQLYFNRTGQEPPKDFLTFTPVRGMDGYRRAEVEIDGRKLRVGIVHGASTARKILEGKVPLDLHFVEVMACRGGCIGGGGLPKTEIPITDALRAQRIRGLYATDSKREIPRSGANPEIQELYAKFLKKPGNPMLHNQK